MKKIVFIHINKCGGSSVKRTISKLENIYIPNNDELINYSLTDEWHQSIKFTIIRNPYDRILSLYGMLKRDNKNYTLNEVINIITDDTIDYKTDNNKLPSGKEYVKRHGLRLTHPHYSIYKNGQIIIDYIFKLENIEKDWLKIQNIIKTNVNLQHVNKSNIKKDYSIFTKDQLNKINSYFKDDFEVFNYEIIK